MLEPSISNGDLNHSVISEGNPHYDQSLESIRIDEEEEEAPIRPNEQEQQEEHDTSLQNDDLDETTTPPPQPFQLGDHVYKWCSLAGIPGVFQHHGIVTEIDGDSLVIADFNNIIRGYREQRKKSLVFQQQKGSMKICDRESAQNWRKVEYKASWLRRNLWRSGTCTAVASDPPGLVLSRVAFLLDYADEKLPNYHFLKANCECVAVWCKTGAWATLQASTFLHAYAAGQAKSAATLAMYASSQQVTIPATGLWGVLGFTTKASLLSTQPFLLPAIAGYGLVTVGGPVWILARCKKAWTQTTDQLTKDFWQNAMDNPESFAECITEWSQLQS